MWLSGRIVRVAQPLPQFSVSRRLWAGHSLDLPPEHFGVVSFCCSASVKISSSGIVPRGSTTTGRPTRSRRASQRSAETGTRARSMPSRPPVSPARTCTHRQFSDDRNKRATSSDVTCDETPNEPLQHSFGVDQRLVETTPGPVVRTAVFCVMSRRARDGFQAARPD